MSGRQRASLLPRPVVWAGVGRGPLRSVGAPCLAPWLMEAAAIIREREADERFKGGPKGVGQVSGGGRGVGRGGVSPLPRVGAPKAVSGAKAAARAPPGPLLPRALAAAATETFTKFVNGIQGASGSRCY